jgi:hypothetical protein
MLGGLVGVFLLYRVKKQRTREEKAVIEYLEQKLKE